MTAPQVDRTALVQEVAEAWCCGAPCKHRPHCFLDRKRHLPRAEAALALCFTKAAEMVRKAGDRNVYVNAAILEQQLLAVAHHGQTSPIVTSASAAPTPNPNGTAEG